ARTPSFTSRSRPPSKPWPMPSSRPPRATRGRASRSGPAWEACPCSLRPTTACCETRCGASIRIQCPASCPTWRPAGSRCARRRGSHVYAELAGYAVTADAHHPTAASIDGPAEAMALALADAGVAPEQVDYINAHGTSTPLNDLNETRAIKHVFGAHAYQLAASSTKSMTGHLLGAAGAVEAIATVLALEHGLLPPTINYTSPDPECDLDYVPNQARRRRIGVAVSNSFGFGGVNASLVFKRLDA